MPVTHVSALAVHEYIARATKKGPFALTLAFPIVCPPPPTPPKPSTSRDLVVEYNNPIIPRDLSLSSPAHCFRLSLPVKIASSCPCMCIYRQCKHTRRHGISPHSIHIYKTPLMLFCALPDTNFHELYTC